MVEEEKNEEEREGNREKDLERPNEMLKRGPFTRRDADAFSDQIEELCDQICFGQEL